MLERAIVYACPNCRRTFDSPSVCMDDGSETEPVLMSVTEQQMRAAKHHPNYTSFPTSGTIIVGCSCEWASERLPSDLTTEELEAAFAAHVGAMVR